MQPFLMNTFLSTLCTLEGNDIIEADLNIRATHTGEVFMGIPARGRKIRFDINARSRFVDGKMAERYHRVDFEDIKRQLTSPSQRLVRPYRPVCSPGQSEGAVQSHTARTLAIGECLERA